MRGALASGNRNVAGLVHAVMQAHNALLKVTAQPVKGVRVHLGKKARERRARNHKPAGGPPATWNAEAMPDGQLTFAFFASLDFPGRSTLMLHEIAGRLGVSVRHMLNEVEAGELVALDLKNKRVSRRCARVPVEAYRDYVLRKLTGPMRGSLLVSLPRAVRAQLVEELKISLNQKP